MHAACSPLASLEDRFFSDEARSRLYHAVLAGMLERGHALDLICLVLGLTRLAVLAFARQAGLADPVDKPLRRSAHPRAWAGGDYRLLAMLWLDDAKTIDIAEQLGRSKSSIWAKRRYLGLPKRTQRPDQAGGFCSSKPAAVAPLAAQIGNAADRILSHEEAMALPKRERRGKTWYVRNSPNGVTITMKPNRDEADWKKSEAARQEAVHRYFAHQKPRSMAEDFGLSYGTMASLAYWLELPKRPKHSMQLIPHYDPNLALFYIKAIGYKERTCLSNQDWRFWGPERNGPRISRRYKSTAEYRRSAGI